MTMQTATLSSKLKGRHYAARARAAQIPKSTEPTTAAESIHRAEVSNERLVHRLNTSRIRISRFHSPSARQSVNHDKNNNNNNNGNSSNNSNIPGNATTSRNNSNSIRGRNETPPRAPTGVRGGRMPYTNSPQKPLTENNTNNNTNNRTKSDREMELVKGMSDLLETGLNEEALGAILDLLKRGESPDAIVAVVTTLAQYAR